MADQTTKQLIDVSDVRNDVVILKDGSLRAIIEVSAINFELRSEDEQVAILQNFQRFLNSIDFPIQIVISSRRMPIDDYLSLIETQAQTIDELLRIQAAEYSRFIKELSTLSNIMSKKFYIVVTFLIVEDPTKVGVKKGITSLFRPSQTTRLLTDEQFGAYRNQLLQRVEIIFSGLIGLGLRTNLVQGDDLVSLFYTFYNPGSLLKKPEQTTGN